MSFGFAAEAFALAEKFLDLGHLPNARRMILDALIIRRFGRKRINVIPSASGRLCRGKTQSNRDIRKRIEETKRFAAPGFVLALLLAISINNPVAAQSQQTTPVTVSQAVKEAVEKNFVLLAERYDLSIADARIVTARLRPNPVLSLYTDLQALAGRGRQGAETWQARLNTGFAPISFGSAVRSGSHRIEVAEQEKAVARWQLLNAMRALALDVQNAFVEVLLAKETLAFAGAQPGLVPQDRGGQ